MKSLKLVVAASAVILFSASFAQAESTDRLNHHFMPKRAYQAPVEHNKIIKADEQWEGATLVPDEATDENSVASKNTRNLKQLRINALSKRPYME